ncbi:Thioredoxin [Phaffia rhodozyma]|uniref:Thioredoxin n=1 Tax=Phaffia rhodozyma TaxID=264483 RepID=A0A0F7SR65_PHARH|nr:Thioredoxin [Phaffia rhodozyma]
MSIKIASSASEFDSFVSSAGSSGLVVVDFHATWCGPCHAIAPVFEKLAKQYPTTTFVKVDTDANRSVASRFSISAMPTFVFLRNGKEVDRLKGANPSKLASLVASLSGPAPAGGWPAGPGNTLSGKPAGISTNSGGLASINPFLVVAFIFFVGPWLYGQFIGSGKV